MGQTVELKGVFSFDAEVFFFCMAADLKADERDCFFER